VAVGAVSAPAGAYSAGAVARRLGVAVTTLRTWHQRYGLGPSLHEPGQHRRYTEQDVARLEAMQRLISDGVAPGEAARWVTRAPAAAPAAHTSASAQDLAHFVRGLHRAATRLDSALVHQVVAHAVGELGVVEAWDGVLRPVLVAIGERHAATGGQIEVEHIVSRAISAVLVAVPRPAPTVPVRIMLACGDEEQHSLPLEALAAALAEHDTPARMLGPRVPPAALTTAVRRTGPAAVLIWSHNRFTADPAQFDAVLTAEPRPMLVAAAGPGWRIADLPEGVVFFHSLREALSALVAQ
jgi:MerR family transcriptional regulator, light-induced transcriptional regulator